MKYLEPEKKVNLWELRELKAFVRVTKLENAHVKQNLDRRKIKTFKMNPLYSRTHQVYSPFGIYYT